MFSSLFQTQFKAQNSFDGLSAVPNAASLQTNAAALPSFGVADDLSAPLLQPNSMTGASSPDASGIGDSSLTVSPTLLTSSVLDLDLLGPIFVLSDNTLTTANNLGTLNGLQSRTGYVGATDTVDFYKFNLSGISNVTLALTGLTADADLRLIQDINNNGVVDAGDELSYSGRGGSLNETLNKTLLAGNYFVQVSQYSGNTNYKLHLYETTPIISATVNRVQAIDNPDTGWFGDNADYYSKISMQGSTWTSGVISNANNIYPNWTYSQFANSRYAWIDIAMWDSDGGLAGADDHIDLQAGAGLRDVNVTLDLLTGNITGDINGWQGQMLTMAGSGDGDRAQIWFTIDSRDWYAKNLGDYHLQNLTRIFAADGSLSRTDMIELLRETKDYGSVDATEVTDLRKIVSDLGYMMPEYVKVLSNKVVNSDPANQWYTGGDTTRELLGNLYAGSSDSQMEKLIGKWFLGSDRPAAVSYGKTTVYSYQQANGSLFVGGASYQDIQQQDAADCYFLAALGATALRSPSTLTNMFIDNGDGTFTVRFFKADGSRDYVTVDRYLPVDAWGNAVYAGWNGGSYSEANNELWVALAEKAYAQINESGWIGQDGTNSYNGINLASPVDAGIGWGWPDMALEQITGLNASNKGDISTNTHVNNVVNAFNAGKMVMLRDASHAYTLVGYNAWTDTFQVYNPYGSTSNYTRNQFISAFTGWFSND
jgi:hypothetical protein